MRLFFLILFSSFKLSKSADVCIAPFNQFLSCLSREANKKLTVFEEDLSPKFQNQISTCYSTKNCEAPDFSRASVDYFFTDPWLQRIKSVLSLLETMDRRVQQCMIRYFSEKVREKVEKCVRQYGDVSVRDFQMPPLPDWQGLDITKLKTAVLNRMMITYKMMQCSQNIPNNDVLQEAIDCVKAARINNINNKGTMCVARDDCRKTSISDIFCLARYDKIQQAICVCFESENRRANSQGAGLQDNWQELREMFQGGMEREYKRCHAINQVPYPQEKVDATKTAIKQAVTDMIFQNGLPERVKLVMRILIQSVREITGSGETLFCRNCEQDNVLSRGNYEAQEIRRLASLNLNQNSQPQLFGPAFFNGVKKLFVN